MMEDPWPLLGFSFIPSHCSEPQHVSFPVPVAPSQDQGDTRPQRVCVEGANTFPAFSLFYQ